MRSLRALRQLPLLSRTPTSFTPPTVLTTTRLLATTSTSSSSSSSSTDNDPNAPLRPLAPTGLCGLLTHPCPLPALTSLYNSTLHHLTHLPPHSVYRQTTTSLTLHRLSLLSPFQPAAPPPGGVLGKIAELLPSLLPADHPAHGRPLSATSELAAAAYHGLQTFATFREISASLPDNAEGPDEVLHEHIRSVLDAQPSLGFEKGVLEKLDGGLREQGTVVGEGKALTAGETQELEDLLGEGLIEEAVNVAAEELKLVKEMKTWEPWRELEVVPEEGQWVGFQRKE